MKRTSNVFAWILTILLALIFLAAGVPKLVGSRQMVEEFARIGVGQWLRYLTGVLEVSGAIGLFIPSYRLLAALQLACVMIGATVTNLWILHMPSAAVLTVVLLALLLVLAWLRRPGAREEPVAVA